MRKFILISIAIFCCSGLLIGQITIKGRVVSNFDGKAIDDVTLVARPSNVSTQSDDKGYFYLILPNGQDSMLVTRVGYLAKWINLSKFSKSKEINIVLLPDESEVEVVVTDRHLTNNDKIRIKADEIKRLPTPSDAIENSLKYLGLGVTGGLGGELTSQYNVRGGNYDENLVYINGFEIFRSQLVKNAQQEGLSFPNKDMIKDMQFSSGGFDNTYGDKMSSVLDIKYKRPQERQSSVELGLLGGSIHTEGSLLSNQSGDKKLRYLLGVRHKNSKGLLGTTDIQGDYQPIFWDIQSFLTYDFNSQWQLSYLFDHNTASYYLEPATRSTTLGTLQTSIRLRSFFIGKEVDEFKQQTHGLSINYTPKDTKLPQNYRLAVSHFRSKETENQDIIGAYQLEQVNNDLTSNNFGNVLSILGDGVDHNYSRNRLYSEITNIDFKSGIGLNTNKNNYTSSNYVNYGIKWQREKHHDLLNEWEKLDSAGYSLPHREDDIGFYSVTKAENAINSYKVTAFIQNTWNKFSDKWDIKLTFGTRYSYWNLNKQSYFSPRFQAIFKPRTWQKDFSFKLAGGVYYQTPYFRELRRPDGTLNPYIKAQKSIQLLAGMQYDFLLPNINDRKFKLIAEAYYKKLSNMISYDIDNVKIRYSGNNDSKGYAYGLDVRVNGEFVPGVESWLNVSYLKTEEKLDGVQHFRWTKENGKLVKSSVNYVPRPSDQRLNFALFFQDYLPQNKKIKANIALLYGSGIPYGFKDNNIENRNSYKYSTYKRVDMGFSINLWDKDDAQQLSSNPFRNTNKVELMVDIFNAIDAQNPASVTWIRDIYTQEYAIPNYLTGRKLNIKLRVEF